MLEVQPCSVTFVSASLGVSEAEIMQAIRDEKLMATGGRSPKTAKVLPRDVAALFKVDIAKLFGLQTCSTGSCELPVEGSLPTAPAEEKKA